MDTNEIIRHGKEIEKLHKNGNYGDISSLLSIISDAHVSLEQLQNTDIAQVLYLLVKSCPETKVRNTSKVLLSKWKRLYSHGQGRVCKHESTVTAKADGSPELIINKQADASSDRCELATADAAASCFQEDRPSAEESGDEQIESQTHSVVISRITPSKTHDQLVPRESSSQEVTSEINSRRVDLETPSINAASEPCQVRKKCVLLLQQALTPEKDPEHADTLAAIAALACDIEGHIHAVYGTNMPKYKACVRSKVANLRNPKCPHLRRGLLSGSLTPETFVQMSVEDMAGVELRRERQAYAAAGINECQLPRDVEGTRTRKLRCKRCQGMDCRVTQISRGTLFLPSWVRQGDPGEEVMTFVTCSGCGQQWYQSGWVCF